MRRKIVNGRCRWWTVNVVVLASVVVANRISDEDIRLCLIDVQRIRLRMPQSDKLNPISPFNYSISSCCLLRASVGGSGVELLERHKQICWCWNGYRNLNGAERNGAIFEQWRKKKRNKTDAEQVTYYGSWRNGKWSFFSQNCKSESLIIAVIRILGAKSDVWRNQWELNSLKVI